MAVRFLSYVSRRATQPHVLVDIIPEQSKYICITIDAQRAAELGVTFFHTSDAELLAVGRNGVIPTQVIRSVVKLDLKKEKLL